MKCRTTSYVHWKPSFAMLAWGCQATLFGLVRHSASSDICWSLWALFLGMFMDLFVTAICHFPRFKDQGCRFDLRAIACFSKFLWRMTRDTLLVSSMWLTWQPSRNSSFVTKGKANAAYFEIRQIEDERSLYIWRVRLLKCLYWYSSLKKERLGEILTE